MVIDGGGITMPSSFYQTSCDISIRRNVLFNHKPIFQYHVGLTCKPTNDNFVVNRFHGQIGQNLNIQTLSF